MGTATVTASTASTFADLLQTAVTTPGTVSAAYSAFHSYSIGNQMYAYMQCDARKIPIGPLASFNRWKELGRHVVKGSKAIELCMPVTAKRQDDATGDDVTYTRFIFRRNWFVLAQTDGADYVAPPLPAWDKARALAALDITEIPFDHFDGNVKGFARARSVAISPIAEHPLKVLFHELAHVVIGHTAEGQQDDSPRTARNVKELQAEGVAMIVCAALGLPGLDDSRGYIQAWYAGKAIDEPTARVIFKTADAILKAGRPAEEKAA